MEDGRDTEVLAGSPTLTWSPPPTWRQSPDTQSGTSPCAAAPTSSNATTASRDQIRRATRTRAACRCTSSAGSAWRDAAPSVDQAGAVEPAVGLFGIDNLRRRRLAVRSLGK
jgi:hypothetical protein